VAWQESGHRLALARVLCESYLVSRTVSDALRPEAVPADTSTMRLGRGHAVLLVVALSLFVVSAGPAPAWASEVAMHVVVRPQPRRTTEYDTRRSTNYECVLTLEPASGTGPEIPAGRGPTPSGSSQKIGPPTGSGNVVVEIPPVVIVRVYGRRLVVTTNTGQPPNPSEAMYTIANGKAGPAAAYIRNQVLSDCTPHARR
jgi:hypothetical protein